MGTIVVVVLVLVVVALAATYMKNQANAKTQRLEERGRQAGARRRFGAVHGRRLTDGAGHHG
jgi:hypothetical protein